MGVQGKPLRCGAVFSLTGNLSRHPYNSVKLLEADATQQLDERKSYDTQRTKQLNMTVVKPIIIGKTHNRRQKSHPSI